MSADEKGSKARSGKNSSKAGARKTPAGKRGGAGRKKSVVAQATEEDALEVIPAEGAPDEELEEDEFSDQDVDTEPSGDLSEDDMDEDDIDSFDGDIEEGEEDIDAVVALSAKEQSARSLEVRRAIEERMEKRKLDEDLDYLDFDFED